MYMEDDFSQNLHFVKLSHKRLNRKISLGKLKRVVIKSTPGTE